MALVNKRIVRKTLLIIVIFLVAIQFFRPQKNIAHSAPANAIEKHYAVPKEIGLLLRSSCYDCHSNTTVYPWYSNIQPIAWWQQNHIIDGKKELNFDEFNSYNAKKKKHKLDEIVEVLQEDEMPLGSYTLIHSDAALSTQAKNELISWAKTLQKTIN